MHFYLPEGLPDRSDAVVVGRESGRYVVEAFGRQWNLAMQCVEHEEELLFGDRWLDRWDRRVRRVQAMVDRSTRDSTLANPLIFPLFAADSPPPNLREKKGVIAQIPFRNDAIGWRPKAGLRLGHGVVARALEIAADMRGPLA